MQTETIASDASAPRTEDAGLPAGVGVLDLNARNMTAAAYGYVGNMLAIADRAWRENRTLQEMMRFDGDIVYANLIRLYMVSMMPMSVTPEDPDDPQQQAECRALEKAIRGMRRFQQFAEHSARAYWYGRSASVLNYIKRGSPIVGRSEINHRNKVAKEAAVVYAPSHWTPIHPDATLFDANGNVGFRVPAAGANTRRTYGDADTVLSWEGPAVRLTDEQRAVTVLNVWGIEAPDWFDFTTSDRMYGGHGLRSYLWYGWFNKQLAEQQAMRYAERLGKGTYVGYHAPGKDAQQRMQEIIELIISSIGVAVPIIGDKLEKPPIELIEPSGTGYQMFDDTVKRLTEPIVKSILGQTLTTGTAATGLGSEVAAQHRDTQSMIVSHDASVMEDSLTADLLRPMQRANFDDQADDPRDYRVSFQRPNDEDDIDQLTQTAERLARMAVPLSVAEIRDRSGFREPEAGEPVVGAAPLEGDPADMSDLLARLGVSNPDPGALMASWNGRAAHG